MENIRLAKPVRTGFLGSDKAKAIETLDAMPGRQIIKILLTIPGEPTGMDILKNLTDHMFPEDFGEVYKSIGDTNVAGVIASINISPDFVLLLSKEPSQEIPDRSDIVLTITSSSATDENPYKRKLVSFNDTHVAYIDIVDHPAKPERNLDDEQERFRLLQVLFPGVYEPSINHVVNFLKDHHTKINTESFILSKGTIPTETTLVYSDVTFSILKMKDGRIYRMFVAKTDFGFEDPGYLATKFVTGRWYQLGRDVYNRNYIPTR